MANILVTGTAGFIGMHLAQKLAAEGHQVTGIDNINEYYDPNLKLARLQQQGINTDAIEYGKKLSGRNDIQFIKVNLDDHATLDQIFKEGHFEFVINLAAQAGVRYSLSNPGAYLNSNVVGFLNILELCRSYPIKHLIFASSSSVYGLNKEYPFSENHVTDHPISLYAASKKSNELMAHTYAHLFGIPVTGLRFFTVYGPWGRPDMAPILFADKIQKGEAMDVYNNGEMWRDFTYVGDICESIYQLLNKQPQPNPDYKLTNPLPSGSTAPYKIYNIGNNNPIKLVDFIEEMEHAFGKQTPKNYLPMQPGDVEKTFADSSSLYNAINFKPATTLRDGIKAFADWYKEYYKH